MSTQKILGWLTSGAVCAIAMATTVPAYAQDAAQAASPAEDAVGGEAVGDEIVVTGLRGSLQRNLDIKRNASGVVDAISSEDIGKFPDPNVAASLQRLPGVTVQLSGARGEATGIAVRGFSGDFNETLYDGRHISTATGGRSVDFSTVGSDFIGGLSVYKTPDVSVGSSSIGATLDVAFPKPLDRPGFHLAATGSGTLQDHSGKVAPTGGLLLSNTFADDTLGILADVVYTRHNTQTNHVSIAGWGGDTFASCQFQGSTATSCNPGSSTSGLASDAKNIVGWRPQQSVVEQLRARDERVDARIAFQWQPTDKLLLTVDDNFSRQTVQTDSFGFAVWFTGVNIRNAVADSNGTLINFSEPATADHQVGQDFNDGINHSILQTNQTGINLKYDVSEKFKVELDGAFSKSWLNPNGEHTNDNGDIGYVTGPNAVGVGHIITGDSKNNLPVLTGLGPLGDGQDFLSPTYLGSHVLVRQAQRNTDVVRQFHIKASYEDEGFKLKFGGNYVQDKFQTSASDTFQNNFWQAFSGYGAASGRTSGLNPLPASLTQGTIGTGNFIPGYRNDALIPGIILYNPLDLYKILEAQGNPQTTNIPSFNYGGATNCGTPAASSLCNYTGSLDLAPNAASFQTIKETTYSAYIQGAFENEIAGMPFHFVGGLRYENTKVQTTALGKNPTGILGGNLADPSLLTITYTSDSSGNPVTVPINVSNKYNYLLPSFDLKLNPVENLTLRFDASRTLTRPALNFLNGALDVPVGQRIGALNASGGNPNLQPYLSDNFDVAGEWYYQSNSYISVDFFLKHVSNFIVQGVQSQTINGLIDPTTGQPAKFSVSQRVNGPDANIRGVEIALQHVFGNSGFGLTANATFVSTDKKYNPEDLSGSGFAVTGLGNSANFVGFYDKNGFQARVAVNWRDSYLLQFGQNQNVSAFGAEPTFVNSQVQVDLSSSYDITKEIQIFGGVTNVNNSTYSTHGRYSNQFLDAFAYGRRYTLGARFHF